MPTIKENLAWNTYNWKEDGDEWSKPWGNIERQWYQLILPKINKIVPTQTILEIAPGHGRCTKYLKELCKKLIIVDLNKNCIDYCKKIFSDDKKIEYFTNNGKDLKMIPSNSIDFIFSWDSFVHIEKKEIEEYAKEFYRVLKNGGYVFIHHSNLKNCKIKEPTKGWRAKSMDYKIFKKICEKNKLNVIRQELVNWNTKSTLTDCFSLFIKGRSNLKYSLIKNNNFMKEAEQIKNKPIEEIRKNPDYIKQDKITKKYLIKKYYKINSKIKELIEKLI